MAADTALADRVHLIYEDCGGRHATDGLRDGDISGKGIYLDPNTVHLYTPELRGLLDKICPKIKDGCSWQECMCDLSGNVWADSITVTELILLARRAHLVPPLLPGEVHT